MKNYGMPNKNQTKKPNWVVLSLYKHNIIIDACGLYICQVLVWLNKFSILKFEITREYFSFRLRKIENRMKALITSVI